MKRYSVQINVGISAKSEKEAARIMREIVESGTTMGSTPTAIAKITLSDEPIVTELPF